MMERLTCDVCPRSCRLAKGQTGFCGARKNVGDQNVDRWYQLVDADPISPWTGYTVTFPGCNLRCPFCFFPASKPTEGQLAKYRLIEEKHLVFVVQTLGERVIAFFGGEPTIHYEYVLETARLCRDRGLITCLYTNGYVNPWLAEELAIAVDYRMKMGVDVSACLDALRIFGKYCKSSTIINLVGPGLATPDDDLSFARWISVNFPNHPIQLIPLHDCDKVSGVWPYNYAPPVEPWVDVLKRIIATIERFNSCGVRNLSIPKMYREVFTGRIETRG
jgi:pyruvate formate lyase activating enzyme